MILIMRLRRLINPAHFFDKEISFFNSFSHEGRGAPLISRETKGFVLSGARKPHVGISR